MPKLSVTDLELADRLALTRVDYNVPLSGTTVTDDSRIAATLPTLRVMLQRRARVVLCAHLGRPKGKPDPKYSLRPVVNRLQQLLDQHDVRATVGFCPDTVGSRAEAMAKQLTPGSVLLLENLRFQPGEEANDPAFARQLAALGDVYVDDAFGAAHRAHASIAAVTEFFKQRAAGLLMERELEYLGQVLRAAAHPFVLILGGAKVGDKLPLLKTLARKADQVLIGGGMAYTFLVARGEAVGKSLVDRDLVDTARELLQGPDGARLVLPDDHVVASGFDDRAGARVCEKIPNGAMALDIGPRTRARFAELIAAARLVFWNGPMGVFEKPGFDAGTSAVARAVADCAGTTVAGGGDSIAALHAAGLADRLTHISGGGASLEFLAGDVLPGVAALSAKV